MVGIYKIIDKENQKVYIGQSIDIERRIKQHKQGHGITLIDRVIKEKGCENFDFIILEICEIRELNRREQHYIKKYDAVNKGYNRSYGTSKDKYLYKEDKKQNYNINSCFVKNGKMTINISKIKIAIIELSPSAFKLYLYFNEWENGAVFCLSPKDFCIAYDVSESTYRRAKDELIQKGYIVQNGKEVHFYDDKDDAPLPIEEYKKKINEIGKNLCCEGVPKEEVEEIIKSVPNVKSENMAEKTKALKEVYFKLKTKLKELDINLI